MGQLDGKVAIVTGASSGIGERIAELFVTEGAKVVGAARRTEEGRALEARCGSSLSFIRTDVSDEGSVKAMIDHAVARFGRIDCLVNNAGSGSPTASIQNVQSEHFDSVFGTNVRGVMFAMKHAAPVMIAQKSGASHWSGGGTVRDTAGNPSSGSDSGYRSGGCVSGERCRIVHYGQDLVIDGGLVPFGKIGWTETVELRAEIGRRIKAEMGRNV